MYRISRAAWAIHLLLTIGLRSQDVLLLDGFENLAGWRTGGQKEISLELSDKHVTQGQHSLRLHVEIDHGQGEEVNKVRYPMGWPAVMKTYPGGIDISGYDFLEFDVFFESRRGVDPDFALNVTAKDTAGTVIYPAVLTDLRHGKWAREKLCIRAIPASDAFGWLSFWLSESSYDDGEIVDFYIDNFRATKAMDYDPPASTPVRRVLTRSDRATLWFEGPARKVRRTDPIDLSGPADPVVRMESARREREAVQLVLRPALPQGVGEVSVSIGDFLGPEGATIPKTAVTWSAVGYVPDDGSPAGGYPDPLPGPKPFVADREWHYPIWIEVYVPEGSPAGDYSAPVVIQTTGGGDLRVELRLHVWYFSIPIRQSLRTSTTIYGPWGWRKDIRSWYGDLEYWPFMRRWRPGIVKLLAAYRISPSAFGHLPLSYDENKGRVVLGDTSEFERIAQSYFDLGHHMDLMPVAYFFDRKGFLGAKKGTDEYLARIGAAYRLAAQYLERKGWLAGCYVYCVDESVAHKHTTKRDFDLLNRVFDTIHAAHPGIRVFGAETPSPLLRGMDIWCTNVQSFDADVLAEQHALGKEVWWYNGYRDPRPGTRIDARGVDHRVLPWMTYKYGIDGYLVWTVNRWSNNPWEEPRPGKGKPLGDHFLLYPNPDGTVSPSIRLAMLRDGLEDYEYHVLLAATAKRLRAAGNAALADRCEAVLRQADAFILSYDNCPHVKPSFIYDSRRRLAKQIETALGSLP